MPCFPHHSNQNFKHTETMYLKGSPYHVARARNRKSKHATPNTASQQSRRQDINPTAGNASGTGEKVTCYDLEQLVDSL